MAALKFNYDRWWKGTGNIWGSKTFSSEGGHRVQWGLFKNCCSSHLGLERVLSLSWLLLHLPLPQTRTYLFLLIGNGEPGHRSLTQACFLCRASVFEHCCVPGKGPGSFGCHCSAPSMQSSSPHLLCAHPTEPSLLGPHTPQGSFHCLQLWQWCLLPTSLADKQIPEIPLKTFHHPTCCLKKDKWQSNEQQMEHKWYHMSDLPSSVRRGARNQSLVIHRGLTAATLLPQMLFGLSFCASDNRGFF